MTLHTLAMLYPQVYYTFGLTSYSLRSITIRKEKLLHIKQDFKFGALGSIGNF